MIDPSGHNVPDPSATAYDPPEICGEWVELNPRQVGWSSPGLPDWALKAFVDDNDMVYVSPDQWLSPERAAASCDCLVFDDGGHVFVEASWLSRQFPEFGGDVVAVVQVARELAA